MIIYYCFRCYSKIDFEQVSEGYFGACLNCDEDMFEFECCKKESEDYKYA